MGTPGGVCNTGFVNLLDGGFINGETMPLVVAVIVDSIDGGFTHMGTPSNALGTALVDATTEG
jgi:hypothetical protein